MSVGHYQVEGQKTPEDVVSWSTVSKALVKYKLTKIIMFYLLTTLDISITDNNTISKL